MNDLFLLMIQNKRKKGYGLIDFFKYFFIFALNLL